MIHTDLCDLLLLQACLAFEKIFSFSVNVATVSPFAKGLVIL